MFEPLKSRISKNGLDAPKVLADPLKIELVLLTDPAGVTAAVNPLNPELLTEDHAALVSPSNTTP